MGWRRGHRFRHCHHQRLAGTRLCISIGEPPDVLKLFGIRRRVRSDFQQRLIAQYAVAWHVAVLRLTLPPGRNAGQNRQEPFIARSRL